jgi:anti-sigma regulatory factor (Ser/Thr protein kinase)
VTEASQVAEARRRAAALARKAGFDETSAGAVAIVVTEAGNNLVRHARQGEILLRVLDDGGRAGIEVLALDRGDGIRDIAESLRDGYSSAGTAGTGLGAIRRQTAEFDIYSAAEKGTAVLARCWAGDPKKAPGPAVEVGAVCLPMRGEEVPGDAWDVQVNGNTVRLLVADGVGHGSEAAQAAAQAVRTFRDGGNAALPDLLERMHGAVKAGRGAVAAIAEVDLAREVVRFTGVGNIAASLWGAPRPQSMVSMNGTLGHGAIRAREFSYPWRPGSLLVMTSDGLSTRWNLDDYGGLAARDPSIVAGVLYRDFTRGHDDVTVLAARIGKPRP